MLHCELCPVDSRHAALWTVNCRQQICTLYPYGCTITTVEASWTVHCNLYNYTLYNCTLSKSQLYIVQQQPVELCNVQLSHVQQYVVYMYPVKLHSLQMYHVQLYIYDCTNTALDRKVSPVKCTTITLDSRDLAPHSVLIIIEKPVAMTSQLLWRYTGVKCWMYIVN